MTNAPANPIRSQASLDRVTGVQIAQGIGVRPPVGFWTDVWHHVCRRPGAVSGMLWIGVVAFFAVFSPLIANGHPITLRAADGSLSSPMWLNLTAIDLCLLVWALLGFPYVVLGGSTGRGRRFWTVIGALAVAIVVLAAAGVAKVRLDNAAIEAARQAAAVADAKGEEMARQSQPFTRRAYAGYVVAGIIGAVVMLMLAVAPLGKRSRRLAVGGTVVVVAMLAIGARWNPPLERFSYVPREVAGEVTATYTLVPWSPLQRYSALDRQPPMTTFGPAMGLPEGSPPYNRRFIMGTDAFGSDVLSALMHSSRLAISIGLVATSIALMIGVTLGALMGYFGGWVDLLLYRVVEIFMAVPVLFLLIVAVAVLPQELRSAYVIMAIIGCFTWTGMARFTRAEFMKLRNLDFVQAAQATGLPLRSVLFKHMLPNGVAPVLVDTSFATAAAIGIEATLSYLGLGPVDSASWGKLLSSAISSEGAFRWWLAVFPGVAIFLTILSYNLIGEALRDAIDPKLKKARV